MPTPSLEISGGQCVNCRARERDTSPPPFFCIVLAIQNNVHPEYPLFSYLGKSVAPDSAVCLNPYELLLSDSKGNDRVVLLVSDIKKGVAANWSLGL